MYQNSTYEEHLSAGVKPFHLEWVTIEVLTWAACITSRQLTVVYDGHTTSNHLLVA